MRIARVLTRLNLGGPARQVLGSDPLLAERGHAVRVLAGVPEPGEGDLFDTLVARGIDVVRVPSLRRGLAPARDLVAGRRVRRELAAFGPDVVHTHASKAGTLGRRALRARAFAATARVHTFHGHVLEGYFPPLVSRRLVAHETRLARETDRIVAVSHATADDLVRLGVVDEARLVVVPPGIELEPLLALERGAAAREDDGWRERLGAGDDAVVAGVVGRLAPVKRAELALEVFELLADRHPGLHLAFVGDGTERRRLERAIEALAPGRRERVHLLGAVEDMRPVLAALDVVLSTSRSEGLPVGLIEAGAAALPVVATPVGGVPEVIADERTGFLGADAAGLARGLDELASAPRLRLEMGARARLRVAARHGAVALADRLEALYGAVVEERRGGRA